MTSSTFLPNQYNFDDKVPEVNIELSICFLCLSFATFSSCIRRQSHWLGMNFLYVFRHTTHLLFGRRCSDTKDPFACLVAADAGLLETVNTQVCGNGFSDSFLLVPVVDGEFIVERPVETILKGKLNAVRQYRLVTNSYILNDC